MSGKFNGTHQDVDMSGWSWDNKHSSTKVSKYVDDNGHVYVDKRGYIVVPHSLYAAIGYPEYVVVGKNTHLIGVKASTKDDSNAFLVSIAKDTRKRHRDPTQVPYVSICCATFTKNNTISLSESVVAYPAVILKDGGETIVVFDTKNPRVV